MSIIHAGDVSGRGRLERSLWIATRQLQNGVGLCDTDKGVASPLTARLAGRGSEVKPRKQVRWEQRPWQARGHAWNMREVYN